MADKESAFLELNESEKRYCQTLAGYARKRSDNIGLKHLLHTISGGTDWEGKIAAYTLIRLGDKTIVPALVNILEKGRGNQHYVIITLGEMGDEGAVNPIIRIAKNPDSPERIIAIQALGQLRSNRATWELTQILEKEEGESRRYAAESLGKIRDHNAVPVLTKAMNDRKWTDRTYALRALADIGTTQAAKYIEEATNDADAAFSEEAEKCLRRIKRR